MKTLKEIKFKTQDVNSDSIMNESIGIPEDRKPKEFIDELIQFYNDEEDKRHELNPKYTSVHRKIISIKGYSGANVDVLEYHIFNHKINMVTITRGNDSYDIIQCCNCKFLFRRFTLETPETMVCDKKRLCLDCNKEFKTERGLKIHNETGKHQVPDWFPDGV